MPPKREGEKDERKGEGLVQVGEELGMYIADCR